MAKCIRCEHEMDTFVLTERGRCCFCGLDVEDMVEILNELLTALKPVLKELEIHHLSGVTENEYCPVCKAIKQARAVIAKAKGEDSEYP